VAGTVIGGATVLLLAIDRRNTARLYPP